MVRSPPPPPSIYKAFLVRKCAFYSRYRCIFFFLRWIEGTRDFRNPSLVSRKCRRRRGGKRCRILHGGNLIPATKIIQVDPPTAVPLPDFSRFSLRKIPLTDRGGDGTTRFHWRNEDEERSVPAIRQREGGVLPLSPCPVSSAEPSRSLSKGTISVFKDSDALPSVRCSRSRVIYARARARASVSSSV